ncbi:MAG: ABC transporter permease [Acidimicrobiia bacterium]
MRAFLSMVRVTLRQVIGGRRWIILGLVALLSAIVMWLSSANLNEANSIGRYHDAPLVILFIIVLPLVALVLGSSALGDERRDGTLSFLLLRPIPRWSIVAAKFTASWLAATAISSVAGILASAALAARAGTWVTLVPTVVGVAVSAACYTAVFLVLGHITSRAVLVGLVYLFVWESGISFAAPALANVSLFRIGLTAYVGLVPAGTPGVAPLDEVLGLLVPGAGGAVAKAVGISIVCITMGAVLLKRMDATGE